MRADSNGTVASAEAALHQLLEATEGEIAEIKAAQMRLPALERSREHLLESIKALRAATSGSLESVSSEPASVQPPGQNDAGEKSAPSKSNGHEDKSRDAPPADPPRPANGTGTPKAVRIELSSTARTILSLLTDPVYGNQLTDAAALLDRVRLNNKRVANYATDETAVARALGELEDAFNLDITGSWMNGPELSRLLNFHGGKTKRNEGIVEYLGRLRRGVGNLLSG